jgi:hypothetical protein
MPQRVDRAAAAIIIVRQIVGTDLESDEAWSEAESFIRDWFTEERQQGAADQGELPSAEPNDE